MTSTSNAATTTTSTATNATNATDAPAFYHNLHVKYIQTLASKIDSKSSYEGAVTEHLRMSGIYWSLTALSLLVPFEELDTLMNLTGNSSEHDKSKPNIVDWVYSCYDPSSGGFGGNQNQDGHILYTLSALQILALAGQGESTNTSTSTNGLLSDKRLLEIKPKLIQFISSLQQEDGSFAGDEWGEVDTRFTYCALSSLSLLGEIDKIQDKDKSGNSHTHVDVDVDKAAMYIVSCQNFDGGFGCTPGAESHAGQIFTCIGALSIARRLDLIQNVELLSWWLAERQCDSGGLNGRPEKQADVCYSWWILSCLCILGRVDYIKGTKLASFILKCQDDDDGGIADRPDDMVDVFHTFFGISGLSLIGTLHEGDGTTMRVIDGNECNEDGAARKYRMIDPVYALPTDVVQSLNLKGQIMTRKKKSENQDVDTNVDADADERLKQYERL